MGDKDFYEVLQVQQTAEPEVIVGAYNKLARKYHPDVNKSPDATRRMQLINEAYEILGDATKRAEYDRQRTYRSKQAASYPQQSEQPDTGTSADDVIMTIMRAAAEVAVPAFVSWMQRQQQASQQAKSSTLPFIVYPSPSAIDVSSTSSCIKGIVQHAQTDGRAYVDYGRSTAYEQYDGPYILSGDETSYTLNVNLTKLTPSTTYHWRLRYMMKGGQTYTGGDQIFTTLSTTGSASTGAAKTTKECPKCGTIIPRSALYCRECRTKR